MLRRWFASSVDHSGLTQDPELSTVSPHPSLMYFPALPLARNVRLGPWLVGTPPDTAPWLSDDFRLLSRRFTEALTKEIGPGSYVWHVDRGFDGQTPPLAEWIAIELSMMLAALDANDRVFGDENAGHYLTTSENARLFVQPLDTEHGWITHSRGGTLRPVLAGGYRIGEQAIPLPDGTVRVSGPVLLSEPLASALFDRLKDPPKHRDRRLRIAIEWHASALSNTRAVTTQQRVIALKTGFEALLGDSNSRRCATLLRELFQRVAQNHPKALPWHGVLWSPREQADILRLWKEKRNKRTVLRVDRRTDLEDWFMHFAEVRNEVIHEGNIATLEYVSPRKTIVAARKRYDGNMFWKAERLLREAIKAKLGPEILLGKRLEELRAFEEIGRALQAQREQEAASQSPQPAGANDAADEGIATTSRPDRSLMQLLDELRVDNATKVYARLANDDDDEDGWYAESDTRRIRVNDVELVELVEAGASLDHN